MKKKPVYMLWTGTIVYRTTGKKLWIAEGCHYDKANPGARDRLNPTYRPEEHEILEDTKEQEQAPHVTSNAWSPYADE